MITVADFVEAYINEFLGHLNMTGTYSSSYVSEADLYTSERDNVRTYLLSAAAIVENEMGRKLDVLDLNEFAIFKMAVFLLAGEYYMQRENTVIGASVASVPFAVERLCLMLRKF